MIFCHRFHVPCLWFPQPCFRSASPLSLGLAMSFDPRPHSLIAFTCQFGKQRKCDRLFFLKKRTSSSRMVGFICTYRIFSRRRYRNWPSIPASFARLADPPLVVLLFENWIGLEKDISFHPSVLKNVEESFSSLINTIQGKKWERGERYKDNRCKMTFTVKKSSPKSGQLYHLTWLEDFFESQDMCNEYSTILHVYSTKVFQI